MLLSEILGNNRLFGKIKNLVGAIWGEITDWKRSVCI